MIFSFIYCWHKQKGADSHSFAKKKVRNGRIFPKLNFLTNISDKNSLQREAFVQIIKCRSDYTRNNNKTKRNRDFLLLPDNEKNRGKKKIVEGNTYPSSDEFGAVVRSVIPGGRFYTGMPWYPVARPSSQAARARCSPDVPLSLRWISPQLSQLPPSFPPGLRRAVLVFHISSAWADSCPSDLRFHKRKLPAEYRELCANIGSLSILIAHGTHVTDIVFPYRAHAFVKKTDLFTWAPESANCLFAELEMRFCVFDKNWILSHAVNVISNARARLP